MLILKEPSLQGPARHGTALCMPSILKTYDTFSSAVNPTDMECKSQVRPTLLSPYSGAATETKLTLVIAPNESTQSKSPSDMKNNGTPPDMFANGAEEKNPR